MTWPTPHHPRRTAADRKARRCPRQGCGGSGQKDRTGSWTCLKCGHQYKPEQ